MSNQKVFYSFLVLFVCVGLPLPFVVAVCFDLINSADDLFIVLGWVCGLLYLIYAYEAVRLLIRRLQPQPCEEDEKEKRYAEKNEGGDSGSSGGDPGGDDGGMHQD